MLNPTLKHKKNIKKCLYLLFLILLFSSAFIVGKYTTKKISQKHKTIQISPKEFALNVVQECKNSDNANFKGKLDCFAKAYYKLTQQQGTE